MIVFSVHGVDDNGKAVWVKPRLPLVARPPSWLIGLEACSGARCWALLFRHYGRTVELMAPKFVTPYRMSRRRGKYDAVDAAAIREAVRRAKMRLVPIREEHQQSQITKIL